MSDPRQATFEGIEPTEVIPPVPNRRRGRPLGTRGKFRSTLDKALRMHWPEATEHLMEGVRQRDPTCTRIYWDRVMPAKRRMEIEVTAADDKPLVVQTPADARAAMAQVLSMVAAGEIAADEADELITCYAKYLAANSIRVIGEASDVASGAGDARQIFNERLTRILEARPTVEAAAAPDTASEAMTEDELTERVMAALERKLQGEV